METFDRAAIKMEAKQVLARNRSQCIMMTLCVLVVEIVKSTFGACRFIVSPTLPHDPLICNFRWPRCSTACWS